MRTRKNFRFHDVDLKAWEAAAKKLNLSLTEWITRTLNDKIKKK